MHKTEVHNGILFYLAVADHKFAVVGDSGIHAVVGDEFWKNIKDTTIEHFKHGEFVQGLIEGISKAGDSLKQYFPYHHLDRNELKDNISFE